MGNGRYCDRHGEWAPDGQCRWCEPSTAMQEATTAALNSMLGEPDPPTHFYKRHEDEQALAKFPLEDAPVAPPPADCYAGIDRASAPDKVVWQMWRSVPVKPVKAADIREAMNKMWADFVRRDRETTFEHDAKCTCGWCAAKPGGEAMPGYDLLPVSRMDREQIGMTAEWLDRNNKFAEIGRAFYAAIRRQQATKAPVYNFSDALELCEKLTASEAKQPAPVLHPYRPEAVHLTNRALAHCVCGCCCS